MCVNHEESGNLYVTLYSVVCMVMLMCVNHDPFSLWEKLALFVALCMHIIEGPISCKSG